MRGTNSETSGSAPGDCWKLVLCTSLCSLFHFMLLHICLLDFPVCLASVCFVFSISDYLPLPTRLTSRYVGFATLHCTVLAGLTHALGRSWTQFWSVNDHYTPTAQALEMRSFLVERAERGDLLLYRSTVYRSTCYLLLYPFTIYRSTSTPLLCRSQGENQGQSETDPHRRRG